MENFEPINEPHQNDVEEGKTAAIISYLFLIGLVVAFIMNNDKKNAFAFYHIRQSVGIQLTGVVLSMIAIIPFLGWLIALIGVIVIFIMWITGLLNALNGKQSPVLILGTKFEEWFSSIK